MKAGPGLLTIALTRAVRQAWMRMSRVDDTQIVIVPSSRGRKNGTRSGDRMPNSIEEREGDGKAAPTQAARCQTPT